MEAGQHAGKTNTANRPDGNAKEGDAEHVVKNGDIGSDGEFQTVAPKSARRKEKFHRDYVEPLPYRNKDRPRLHAGARNGEINERSHKDRDHVFSAKDCSKDKDKDKEKDRDAESWADDADQQPVKYVEAPLPAVNPWMKSKGNVVTAQHPAVPAPSPPKVPAAVPVASVTTPLVVVEKPVEKEKRVLQPPQQQKVKVGE